MVANQRMKIYKYRDLRIEEDDEYIFDIILNNRIWCAKPSTLNDPKEFNFNLDYSVSGNTLRLLSQVLSRYGSNLYTSPPPAVKALLALENGYLESNARPIVDDIIKQCRAENGVSSFSMINNDPWLWKEYGGCWNGLCIEFEIPDHLIGELFHCVDYVDNNVFHVDAFLESAIDPSKVQLMYRKMLATKTVKWKKEKEIRMIGKVNNIALAVGGPINKIEYGFNVTKERFEQFHSNIRNYCETKAIEIRRHKC